MAGALPTMNILAARKYPAPRNGLLSMEEITLARGHEAVTVSLGPRNLRSETAAIAAVARLMEAVER